MTHDELLDLINEPNPTAFYTTKITTELAEQKEDYILSAFMKVGINPQVVIEQDALIKQLKAQLRAVVELHKEYGDINGRTWCDECEGTGYDYPCPTIQAIEKALS